MSAPVTFRNIVWQDGYHWVKSQGKDVRPVKNFTQIERELAKGHMGTPSRPSGYFITRAGGFTAGDLVAFLDDNPPSTFSTVEVESDPALFRTFAGLPPKPDEIANFASKWGLLLETASDRDGSVLRNAQAVPENTDTFTFGEPLEIWASAIAHMRIAVQLWEGIQNTDEDALISLLRELRRVPIGVDEEQEARHRLWLRSTSSVDDSLNAREPVEAACDQLSIIINDQLSSALSLMLSRETDMAWELSLNPNGLLNALWLQFAYAIAGGIQHRACIVCNAWFEVAPGRGRREKRFCSDACRMRAYRNRKSKAEGNAVM